MKFDFLRRQKERKKVSVKKNVIVTKYFEQEKPLKKNISCKELETEINNLLNKSIEYGNLAIWFETVPEHTIHIYRQIVSCVPNVYFVHVVRDVENLSNEQIISEMEEISNCDLIDIVRWRKNRILIFRKNE